MRVGSKFLLSGMVDKVSSRLYVIVQVEYVDIIRLHRLHLSAKVSRKPRPHPYHLTCCNGMRHWPNPQDIA